MQDVELTFGDLVWSEVHRCYVRVLRVTGDWVTVMDRDTHRELPDQVQRCQVRFAR